MFLLHVCISDPLFAHLFIKQPLTPNQCCPECRCMCVNDKMIYRNIPKIKPGTPPTGERGEYYSLNGPCGEHTINACILKHIAQVYAHKLRGLFWGTERTACCLNSPVDLQPVNRKTDRWMDGSLGGQI